MLSWFVYSLTLSRGLYEAAAGSIKTWADLEMLFLTLFFEDDTEVAMPILLATK